MGGLIGHCVSPPTVERDRRACLGVVWGRRAPDGPTDNFTLATGSVQGRSRSSMLVPPESSSAVFVMIRCKSVSICNRSRSRRANSGEVTISAGVTSLMPSFEGNLLTRRHEICSQETIERLYAVMRRKPGVSISPGLGLVPGCDGRTDRQNCEQRSAVSGNCRCYFLGRSVGRANSCHSSI